MAQTFAITSPPLLKPSDQTKRRKVLVTGASGQIGTCFAEQSAQKYDLSLLVRDPSKARDPTKAQKLASYGRVVEGDVLDLNQMKKICEGIDTIVHLAGERNPNAEWESLLDYNIIGTYNTFVAAKYAGCRRVIYASSIHAVSGYPQGVQIKTNEPVNPGDLYGVSKCFGEALSRYMAEQEGLSSIVIRIGWFNPFETVFQEDKYCLVDHFVSDRDMNQLIHRCIDVENLRFAIFHGLSNNLFNRLDISDTREILGYQPQDDMVAQNSKFKDLKLRERMPQHNMSDLFQKSGFRKDLEPT